jgi:RHS repeat-associated protein
VIGTRVSSWEYQATTGLLSKEVVEPMRPNECVQTTHGRDTYGNVNSSTVSNCSGVTDANAGFTPRRTVTTFGSYSITLKNAAGTDISVAVGAGTFPRTVRKDDGAATTVNGVTHQETRTFDPRFGVLTRLSGPNNQNTDVTYDDFGRKQRETRIDGTYTQFISCLIPGRVSDTSSNLASGALTCPATAPAEAPGEAVQFVHSQSYGTNNVANGPYVRVFSDRLGRQIRTVTQSFDGNGQAAGLIYQDIIYNEYGAKLAETQPYFAGTQSSTLGNAAAFGRTYVVHDVLGRPVETYVSDPAAATEMPPIAVGILNGRFPNVLGMKAAKSTVVYSGLSVQTTNARGQTTLQEKDPAGQVIRSTDALGAQVAMRFDAFGNLVQTVDGLGNQTGAEFDVRGRRTQMTDPNTGEWRYAYNALGELRWQQSPNQRAAGATVGTTMDYDVLGRLLTRTTSGASGFTTTWTFDRYLDASSCNRCIGKLTEVATSHGVARRFTFDTTGRLTQTRTTASGGINGGTSRVFTASQSWDATKGWVATQTYPSGVAVRLNYTALGFMERLTNNANSALLWQAQRINAWGRAETQIYGNNVQTRTEYQATTGRMAGIDAGLGSATNVLNHDYAWDAVGNLSSRTDLNGDAVSGTVFESFKYDAINRLYEYTVTNPAINGGSGGGSGTRTVTAYFNAGGNILAKSDVGAYAYPANGAARAHAVQTVRPLGGGSITYAYDANGNLTGTASTGTSIGERAKVTTIGYTAWNLPDSAVGVLGANGTRLTWHYDESHARIKETKTSTAGTRTTWSLHPDKAGGLFFEQEFAEAGSGGTVSNRHYLSAGGTAIGVLITQGDTWVAGAQVNRTAIVRTEYWHKDHLGSTAAVTDGGGAVTARYAYDPWGKRRGANGTYDAFGNILIDDTPGHTGRGFTGHEHLDEVGLIHMNGRLYDAHLGRFMQADPMLQMEHGWQAFNRYSYVLNNPLNATDPTGESIEIAVYAFLYATAIVVGSDAAASGDRWFAGVIAILVTVGTGSYPGGWEGAALGGFASGMILSGGDAKAGLQGAASALLFYGAGQAATGLSELQGYGGEAVWGNAGVGRAILHGVAGCASAKVSGANCGRGAGTAAATKYLGANLIGDGPTDGGSWGDRLAGTTTWAVLGGTLSKLNGEKFANGAITAAFQYLFNQARGGGRGAVNVGVRGFAGLVQDMATADFQLAEPEVWGRTGDGERFRVDGVFGHSDGRTMFGGAVVVCESKCGPTSELSARQVRIYDAISKNDFYLEGPRAVSVANKLGLTVDTEGRVFIPANRFDGPVLGVYAGSAAHLKPSGQKVNWGLIMGVPARGSE